MTTREADVTAPQPPTSETKLTIPWDRIALACALLAAAGLITRGLWIISEPAGWICAGVLLAGVAVLFLLDVPPPSKAVRK